MPIAFFPVIGHHWEQAGSLFFIPFHQVFIHIDKILLSLLFSRIKSSISLSLSSYKRCSSPLINYWPFTALAPVCPCLTSARDPRTRHSTPDVSLQCWVEGKVHSPWPAGNTPPNASQDAVGLLCFKGALLAHGQLLVHRDLQSSHHGGSQITWSGHDSSKPVLAVWGGRLGVAVFMLCGHVPFVGQGSIHFFAQDSNTAEDNLNWTHQIWHCCYYHGPEFIYSPLLLSRAEWHRRLFGMQLMFPYRV